MISAQQDAIYAALQLVEGVLPDFEIPQVTIAFGILNTGGTTSKGHILIGAGMVCTTSDADVSELSEWQRSVTIPSQGTTQDIKTLIAHEAVHTRQTKTVSDKNLVVHTIYEGVCDFVVYDLLNFPIEGAHHRFGESRECEVWKAFEADRTAPKEQKQVKWLYGGDHTTSGYPADMGYFIGRRISAAYYAQASDKELALKELLNPKKYKQIFEESGYGGGCE